ncbi:DUF6600 domain-containing protein [Ideonella livida]|uniref:FecR protein domain-containing protein n=1 Tax=Ideonella livida TaxID=2707176 RepID=A0A7C9PG00_9BURK|nr:DUF6600 domain-containing protein [Ideonella livida]NDY90768.1 hypothetical protein [Ideonella livida]
MSKLALGLLRWWRLALLLGLLLPAVRAGAQGTDWPTVVLRLSWVAGQVVWQAGSEPEQPAQTNQPLVEGDRLRLGAGAQAEVQWGAGTLRAVGPATLHLERADERRVDLSLGQGRVVWRPAPGSSVWHVRTPEGDWQGLTPGVLVVEREGQGSRVQARGGSWQVHHVLGQEVLVDGQVWQARWLGVGLQTSRSTQVAGTSLTPWQQELLRAEDEPAVQPAVVGLSVGLTGAGDLHRHGTWDQHPEWGAVWRPHAVPPGWQPFQQGRWWWREPWGWVWLDDAPWGFAPFHHGSWMMWRGAWWWVPDPHPHPQWAPAIVDWQGLPGARPPAGRGPGHPGVGWVVRQPDRRIPPRPEPGRFIQRVDAVVGVPSSSWSSGAVTAPVAEGRGSVSAPGVNERAPTMRALPVRERPAPNTVEASERAGTEAPAWAPPPASRPTPARPVIVDSPGRRAADVARPPEPVPNARAPIRPDRRPQDRQPRREAE